jgi:hypothetical protein
MFHGDQNLLVCTYQLCNEDLSNSRILCKCLKNTNRLFYSKIMTVMTNLLLFDAVVILVAHDLHNEAQYHKKRWTELWKVCLMVRI